MAIVENQHKPKYGCYLLKWARENGFGEDYDCSQECLSCPVRENEIVASTFGKEPMFSGANIFVSSNLVPYYPDIAET